MLNVEKSIWVQLLDGLHGVVFQLVHEIQLNQLLLNHYGLVVDDVGEQPQGLLAQVDVVRSEKSH